MSVPDTSRAGAPLPTDESAPAPPTPQMTTAAAAKSAAVVMMDSPTLNTARMFPAAKRIDILSSRPSVLDHWVMNTRQRLGAGSFGSVVLATNVVDNSTAAVKIIQKSRITKPQQHARVSREMLLQASLHHPNIVAVHRVLESADSVYIVMEYCPGGQLFDLIVARQRLTSREARHYFRQVLSAVAYCHKNCIAHRDIKPENLLLSKDGDVKISDFGFANQFSRNLAETYCGSPYYTAPEILQGTPYDAGAADIWSLGIVLYAMLTGCLPFNGKNIVDLLERINKKRFHTPKHLTEAEIDLLTRLLDVNPLTRISLDDLLQHPWVTGAVDGPALPVDLHLPERLPVTQPDMAVVDELVAISGRQQEEVLAAIDPEAGPSPLLSLYYLTAERLSRRSMSKTASTDSLGLSDAPTPYMSSASPSPTPVAQSPRMQRTFAAAAAAVRQSLAEASLEDSSSSPSSSPSSSAASTPCASPSLGITRPAPPSLPPPSDSPVPPERLALRRKSSTDARRRRHFSGNVLSTLGEDDDDTIDEADEAAAAARMSELRRPSDPTHAASSAASRAFPPVVTRRRKLTLLHHLPFIPARNKTTLPREKLVDLLVEGAQAKGAGYVIDEVSLDSAIVRDPSNNCVIEVSLREDSSSKVDVLVRRRRGSFSKHRVLNDRILAAMHL